MTNGRCPGCGAESAAIDGATHPYVGASSSCGTQFSEVNWALPPTVFDVATVVGTADAPDVCERYVRSIWATWAQHHDTVEAWARLPS